MISNPYPSSALIRRKKIKHYVLGGDERFNPEDSSILDSGKVDDISPIETNSVSDTESPMDTEEEKAAKQQKKQQRNQAIGNGVRILPFAIDAIASYSNQIDQNARMRDAIVKQNRQKPIFDINAMYGDNQPIIKAKNGAMVRSTSSDAAPFKIDNGEFLMLPDGKLEKAQGNSKKTDDISTILPQGTKIFSNTLKPNKSKDTFAKLASKHDYSKELEMLQNPYTTPVSRTSAERMLQRKQKALNSLFEEQQSLNGDSSGEMVSNDEVSEHKSGGWISKAVNPKHKGYCTPMTKSTCTGHRRALALTFKKHHGFHHEDGGDVEYAYGGELKTGRQPIPIADPYGPSDIVFDENGVQPMNDLIYRNPKKLLDENGRMIYKTGGVIKYDGGGKNTQDQWYNNLKAHGYIGKNDPGAMQDWLVTNHPDVVVKYMKDNAPESNTNLGRKLYGNADPSKFTDEQWLKAFKDNKYDWRSPLPGGESPSTVDAPEFDPTAFSKMSKEEQSNYMKQKGHTYNLSESQMKGKTPYSKKGIPLYQLAPEATGFLSSLNTYNYQTPDYQHWEMSPNKLNIQPQLQSIDASLNGINQTTTGDPRVDYIRKIGAFTQALNAKQQVYSNKQNYDAEKEFQANQYNISARTNEQNLDINAQNDIYNNKMPLARDYATGERIAALSSAVTKVALNEQNENKKKIALDNFYGNIQVNPDGTWSTVGSGKFQEQKYATLDNSYDGATYTPGAMDVQSLTKSTPSSPIAIDAPIAPLIKPIDLTPPNTVFEGEMRSIKNKKPMTQSYLDVPYTPYKDGGYVPIKKRYSK